MISLKDLETLIDDDELLDMVIFAKCMKSDNSKLLGLKKNSIWTVRTSQGSAKHSKGVC